MRSWRSLLPGFCRRHPEKGTILRLASAHWALARQACRRHPGTERILRPGSVSVGQAPVRGAYRRRPEMGRRWVPPEWRQGWLPVHRRGMETHPSRGTCWREQGLDRCRDPSSLGRRARWSAEAAAECTVPGPKQSQGLKRGLPAEVATEVATGLL